jgi:hypothetical protein
VTGLQTALDGKAASSHTHAASDITSGTLDAARLPLATTGAAGAVIVGTGLGVSSGTVSVTYGTSSTSACRGDDSRLSDARTPTSHTHGNITNAGAIGSTADQFVVTTTSGVLTAVSAATARTTLSVQPTASPTFTGTAIVSGTFQVKANSGSLSHAFGYNENGGEISLYTTSEVQASLIDHVGGTGTRVLELVNGNDLYLGLGSGNTTGNVKIQRAGYVTAVTVSSTGTATFAGQVLVTAGSGSSGSYKPGVAISGDDDTGVQQTTAGGANTLSVVTNGTERVRVGSGGRVQFFANNEKYGIQINNGSTGNGPFLGSDGADILTISTAGGAERVRVDASGNVGIGASPGTTLDIQRASADAAVFVQGQTSGTGATVQMYSGSGLGYVGTRNNYPLLITTNNSERMRVSSAGNVTIGEANSANTRLMVAGGSSNISSARATYEGTLQINESSLTTLASIGGIEFKASVFGSGYGVKILGADDGALIFGNRANSATWSESMRITQNREMLIGTTSDNGAYLLQVNSQIYATNATIATSDARFKTNVESLTDATSVIESLRPVAFDFIPQADRNFATERQVGLIAQETQAALAGTDYADSVVAQCGDHLGLAYEKLVPVLIKALQESNARIAALEERING